MPSVKEENVLIIGDGGREHALAWKLAQSPRLGDLYVSPGNGGTRDIAINVSINLNDFDEVVEFVKEENIHLVVIGPDQYLATGLVDALRSKGIRVFGPSLKAARIETSKAFAKRLMRKLKIRTAPFRIFKSYDEAIEYLGKQTAPIVIKASGLARGKGVYVCKSIAKAKLALADIMINKKHKDAGNEAIIEDFVEGEEVSAHIFTDGKNFIEFPKSRDYKRKFNGNKGLNTGGMGACAPVIVQGTNCGAAELFLHIFWPVMKELAKQDSPFVGCLYPGLKITQKGLSVLEFNARMGDPETQVYMRLLETDILDILDACVDGKVWEKLSCTRFKDEFAVCVVLSSHGYPGNYRKGYPIYGIRQANSLPGVYVFHAGTRRDRGVLRTAGGRVLNVTATGKTLKMAIRRAYEAVKCITFVGMHFRKDIGL